jgi:hypothetical protein
MVCSSPKRAIGQIPQNAAVTDGTLAKPTISLAHLYWHFLLYQDYLDQKAETLRLQGKSTILDQVAVSRLGWTEAEFAPVRNSAAHLSSLISTLDARAKISRSQGISASEHQKLKELTKEREDAINVEMAVLANSLSPEKKLALDQYILQLFAAPTTSHQVTNDHPVNLEGRK